MIDSKFIGKTYPAVTFHIETEKLKEFLIAIKAEKELFTEYIHPTFPVVFQHDLLAAVLFDPELKLNLKKLVHGEQEFIYLAPIRIGDIITTSGTITQIMVKGKHDFVVFETISLNQNNETVLKSIWTFVIRDGNDKDFNLQQKLLINLLALLPQAADHVASKKRKSLEQKTNTKINPCKAKQDLLIYDQSKKTLEVFIDKYMPQVYAGASGDFNIIHLDPSYARQAGLGTNILHGMATMAMGINLFTHHYNPLKLKRYKARFTGIVRPMDILLYEGQEKDNAFKFKASNQHGQEILSSCVCEFT